jgi:hypothetical protein
MNIIADNLELLRVSKESGGLVEVSTAALFLRVSKCRIYQLIKSQTVQAHCFQGKYYLSIQECQKRFDSRPCPGRPSQVYWRGPV